MKISDNLVANRWFSGSFFIYLMSYGYLYLQQTIGGTSINAKVRRALKETIENRWHDKIDMT